MLLYVLTKIAITPLDPSALSHPCDSPSPAARPPAREQMVNRVYACVCVCTRLLGVVVRETDAQKANTRTPHDRLIRKVDVCRRCPAEEKISRARLI